MLQPLPPMKNIGMLSTTDLNSILRQFPDDPRLVKHDGEIVKTITTDHGETLLSAAKMPHRFWHVRAREGLIQMHIA